MSNKHPKCECTLTKWDYFKKKYRNGTLHLMRRCPQCGKIAQNPMPQREYDRAWVEALPIMSDGVLEHSVQSRGEPVQSRAAAIHQKLKTHIANRTA